jgi:putative oxidoreductase
MFLWNEASSAKFGEMSMSDIHRYADLAGRILISLMFLTSGVGKITGYAATQGYMQSMGVPGVLLPLVIVLEVAGPVAIILGWKTRWFATALGGFCVISALLFHGNFTDQGEMISFMKNITIAGGFLIIVAFGAGPLSLDARLAK